MTAREARVRPRQGKQYEKFGYQDLPNGEGFALIATSRKQMGLLAELASIHHERISSFGPVTDDDSLTAVLFVTSRKGEVRKKKRHKRKGGPR